MTEHENSGGQPFKLDCLFNWMRFLTSDTRQYCHGELAVDAYGELDDSYVVIESQVSQSPMAVHQYLLHTNDFVNSLAALVALLKEFGFDLDALVSKLKALDYDEEGQARLEHISVYFKLIEEFNPNGEGQISMKDKTTPKAPNSAPIFKKRKFDSNSDVKARSIDEIARSLSPFEGKGPAGKPADVEQFDEWE